MTTADFDARNTSGIRRLLLANRGEVAIRIARAAAELGIQTVGVHAADDAQSLHTRAADEVRALPGSGPAAYLDIEQLIAVAREAGCDAVHPGYGFLSESAAVHSVAHSAAVAGPTADSSTAVTAPVEDVMRSRITATSLALGPCGS